MKRLIMFSLVLCGLMMVMGGCASVDIESDSVNIDASTTVINKNSSTNTTITTGTTAQQILSEKDVKQFALLCAGTSESRISDYSCKLGYHEERKCQVYEISFKVGRTLFEYIFRATDCDIILNKKTIGE